MTLTTIGGAYGGILGPDYAQQLQGNCYNQQNAYSQLAQQAHIFGQAYGIVEKLPEKVFKTAKGFLAELREEIDAWHGDCLRA